MKMGRRRGIAGIVATVIIFAILFTVGTSYFIFENSQNASYVQDLLSATNKAQASLTESLSVTTLLETNGDVGFFANNTSSATVNMTAVLVVSSTGTLLKCAGVGFPGSAGCSNTTPTLWVIINSGKGSPTIDTGYLYVASTTDTLKVLTHSGKVYSQTYPEPASQTGSTQSVSVSLNNLKWVQLIPQASSLVQKKYLSNCNAANCALAYTSSVTAGNILVDGIGWAAHSPPSTPTDTLGDSFTLGASQSVAVSSSPALVQDKYTSNCNAASCGLAFTSNVGQGNTLVYAVGWANQSPPSAPTDTRGDSFTLGASQSVTVNPISPSLVQHRYLANCSSATCALAYTSSVTAGNTLIGALGWPSAQLYNVVPVTVTNNQGSSTPSVFQQMVTWDPATYSAYEATNLGNVRFCSDSQCVTPLNAWLESCSSTCSTNGSSSTSATAWVKLTSAIAGSGGTLTIYMVFEAASANFDGNHWGEAPQLSGTYAQYDNGANVFTAYFNGNTATSSFSVFSGYSLSKASGISGPGGATINAIEATGYNANNPVFSFNTAMSNVGLITESSFSSPGSVSPGTDTGVVGLVNNAAASSVNNAVSADMGYNNVYFDQDYESGGTVTTDVNPQGAATSSWVYATLTYAGSAASSWSAYIAPQFYSATGGYSGTVSSNPLSSATNLYLGQISATTNTYALTIYYNFDRARAYPPSGIMPSTSFGSLSAGNGAPTLSDTLGDSFTLGASQSVAGSAATPSVVQHNYASNCNSSSCGVAYSSSVTAGNTLVYGLGWYGQSPPSAPTDTRGDSFTLGASNSVQVGSAGSLALDGSASGTSATATATTGTLTTSGTSDVIIVNAGTSVSGTTVSSVTATGLTFHHRVSVSLASVDEEEEWYATTTSTFSGTISVTWSAAGNNVVEAFGISGANTASPFDAQSGNPVTATGSGSNPTASITTSNANDFVFGLTEDARTSSSTCRTISSATGTNINEQNSGATTPCDGVGGEYVVESTTQSGLAVSFSLSSTSTTQWTEIADAVQASTPTIYYSYVWYATAVSSGADTVTTSFGSSVTGSVSVYELSGVTPSYTSAGGSSTGTNTASVASFTPSSNSVVIGNAETTSATFTSGGSYSLVGTCSAVFGCNEYATGMSSATTVSFSLGTSVPWVEVALSFAPAVPTYYSYVWYATASSSGADTITATFGSWVAGSVSVYEIAGYSTSGTLSSTSSSSGSTAASVGSFTPGSNSFVVGNVETGSSSTRYTVGAGYTTVASGAGGCDASDAAQGCNEYESGLGSATTTPFTLSASTQWADAALSFTPLGANTYYSYMWYTTAASSGADTITASFSQAVAGSVSIYEFSGVTATGLLSQTGSSSASQGATAVTSMTPTAGSVVIGNSETTSTTYTAGSGYTLSGSCSSVTGCGEYQTGVGSATTVPMSISPSAPWVEAALAFAPTVTTYYSYIWYATAGTSGADTITAAFGTTVAGSVSIYELTGFTTSGLQSSTGSSPSGSTTSAVSSYTPLTNTFTVGNTEGASGSTTYTATTGFTLVGSCNSVGGCSEYNAGGGGSATTVPTTLGSSTPWVESALSFDTPFNPQSGIQVGGYPTMGVASGAQLAWEVTFTNVDSQHRTITVWPQTELSIGSEEYNGYDTSYTEAHYYIIDSLNPGSATVVPYTQTSSQFLTLAYDVPTTLYFAATVALGSTTQAFGTSVLQPFEAYFALTGIFSDGTLFGETIPYPYGIITQSNAYTTPTAGATGATVTVSCTSPCHFNANAQAAVLWINSAGQATQLTTFTTNGSGNVPSGVTFHVPNAAAGYYTLEVTDYTNSVFMTFQHT